MRVFFTAKVALKQQDLESFFNIFPLHENSDHELGREIYKLSFWTIEVLFVFLRAVLMASCSTTWDNLLFPLIN